MPRYLTLPLLLAAISAAAQQPPAFQSEVNLVNITAVVRSTAGHLLSNLNQDQFELTEDGVPQTIKFFARETELPLRLGVVVDVSGSQEKFLKQHNRDVADFLKTVLRPSDEAFVVCFGNHLRLINEPASAVDTIMESLARFQKGDRRFPELGPKEERDLGTALYDAVYFSITEKLNTAGERRRALIVFTDGEENSSEHDLLDVIEAAQNTDTLVYCVRYTQEHHGALTARNKYGIRALNHIATLSGGSDFDALSVPLNQVFAQISQELRSLYQIGYVSSNANPHDASFRKLTLRCNLPGATVRSKTGYYAR